MAMKATKQNIRDVLGVHARGINFERKNPINGFILKGFLPRYAINDLDHNFHIYMPKSGGLAVVTTGRLNASQKGI
jgi:hypothetical protein